MLQFVACRRISQFYRTAQRWLLEVPSTLPVLPSGRRCRTSGGGSEQWNWRRSTVCQSAETSYSWLTSNGRPHTRASPSRPWDILNMTSRFAYANHHYSMYICRYQPWPCSAVGLYIGDFTSLSHSQFLRLFFLQFILSLSLPSARWHWASGMAWGQKRLKLGFKASVNCEF